MAITLEKIEGDNINVTYDKTEKNYTMNNDGYIVAMYTKGEEKFKLTLYLKKGFRTDGASVPKAFTWFLPKWDEKHPRYNYGAMLHDVLYTTKGDNKVFSREECDDFFRGAVRIAGYNRFKAGVADKCIEWFASSPEHWGSDDLDNLKNNLIYITIEKK